jgi:TnpA family transposase
LIRNDNQALRRDRLSWVSQNYLRDETLSAANAILVAAQSQLELVYFRENQRLGLSLVGRQNV